MGILCRLPGIAPLINCFLRGIPCRLPGITSLMHKHIRRMHKHIRLSHKHRETGRGGAIVHMQRHWMCNAPIAITFCDCTAITVLVSSLYNIKMHLYDKNQDRFL